MNLEFVNTVLQIIGQHGKKILADVSKCEALLLENVKGKYEHETSLFIKALEMAYPVFLQSKKSEPADLRADEKKLVETLQKDYSVVPQAAEEMLCFLRELITGEVEILSSNGKFLSKNGFHFMITDGQSLMLGEGDTDCPSVIPDNIFGIPVTSIAKMAFRGCVNLTEIVIPPSVTDIGDFAFVICNNLTKITVSRHAKFGKTVFTENTKIVYSD